MSEARGSFEITRTAKPNVSLGEGPQVSQMGFHKRFAGELDGESFLEMLGLLDAATKSGGYVALERFSGTLGGRRGTFCLQHSSTMTRGQPSQSITVIPDSGTGELAGLSGSMIIDITDGKHFYRFDYAL
jgi:hypothetical protein